MTSLDLDAVCEWVQTVYPSDMPGLLNVVSNGDWGGRHFERHEVTDLLAYVHTLDSAGRSGIYLRVSTMTRPEVTPEQPKPRGGNEHTVALPALWADIDLDTIGHKHDPNKHEGRRLPPTVAAGYDIILKSGLPLPTTWMHSGGGLYPIWLFHEPLRVGEGHDQYSLRNLSELSAHWQLIIERSAAEQGWHYGRGVGDLARVLRIPGTVNRKLPEQPRLCTILEASGPRLHPGDAIEAVMRLSRGMTTKTTPAGPSSPRKRLVPIPWVQRTRLVAPESPYEDAPVGAVGPLDDFAVRNDLDDLLVADGWTFAYEHQGRRHYARPGKNPRDGVSGNVYRDGDRQVLYVFSEEAGLPTMRGLSPGEWYAHRYHGGDLRAASRALRTAGYGTPPTTSLPSTGSASETPTGMSTPVPLPALVSNVVEEIWVRRPLFTAIRTLARERLVGPWAVLGAVLAQAACRIGPHVQLPPITGGYASLNLFVGLVGPSGAGKDAALAVAEELLGVASLIPTKKLGTGQGIDASYTAQTKEGPVQYNDVALFTVGEIDSLAAHSQMNGSTLMATMREVYSGSALGAHYADRFKRRPVGQHQYRAAVVAGIQPLRSGVLLDDADGGTPQRWLWMAANDPDMDKTEPKRRIVGPQQTTWWTDYEVWAPSGEQDEGEPVVKKDRVAVRVCETAVNAVRASRAARLSLSLAEQAGDLGGHMLLTRLKVAAVLGFLERRAEVTDDDWELAGLIMTHSEHTRGICQSMLAQRATERNRQRAKAEGERAVVAEEARATQVTTRLQAKLMKKLQTTPGQWWPRGKLNSWAGRDRAHLGEALEELVSQGLVESQEDDIATRFRAVTK